MVYPIMPQNILGLSIFSFVVFATIMVLFASVIFFILLVSYLGQWDIYWPSLYKWLRVREAKALEKERKRRNRERKREKKYG